MNSKPKSGKVVRAIAYAAVVAVTGCIPQSSAKLVSLENSTLNLSTIAESEPTAKPVAILTGHPSYVQAIAITSDGQILASSGDDNSIKIWNLPQGIRIRTLTGHSKPVHAIAISPSDVSKMPA